MNGPAARQEEEFAEDILSMVSEKPVLFNELVAGLRGNFMVSVLRPESSRRWKNVRPDDVEKILRDFGAFFATRKHGAGLAVYVASAQFNTVIDGRGRERDVAHW